MDFKYTYLKDFKSLKISNPQFGYIFFLKKILITRISINTYFGERDEMMREKMRVKCWKRCWDELGGWGICPMTPILEFFEIPSFKSWKSRVIFIDFKFLGLFPIQSYLMDLGHKFEIPIFQIYVSKRCPSFHKFTQSLRCKTILKLSCIS